WSDRHFSNTQVFEKWSKAKIAFLFCVVEKVADRLFQHPASPAMPRRGLTLRTADGPFRAAPP
ncbi:MAG TPA: hypothetical protein VGA00_02040, partial [Acidiferrobacterales bacterium]